MENCRNWTSVLVMASGGGGDFYQIRCLLHANSKKLPFAAFYETRVQDSTFPFSFRCSNGWLHYFTNEKLFTFPRPYFLSLLVSGCRFRSTKTKRKMNLLDRRENYLLFISYGKFQHFFFLWSFDFSFFPFYFCHSDQQSSLLEWRKKKSLNKIMSNWGYDLFSNFSFSSQVEFWSFPGKPKKVVHLLQPA